MAAHSILDFASIVAILNLPETRAAGIGVLLSGLALPLLALDLELRPEDLQTGDVRIQEHGNRQVEEYRVNGQLYKVKIQPKVGAPYYLVDTAGTGDFEYRRDGPGQEDLKTPQWALYRW